MDGDRRHPNVLFGPPSETPYDDFKGSHLKTTLACKSRARNTAVVVVFVAEASAPKVAHVNASTLSGSVVRTLRGGEGFQQRSVTDSKAHKEDRISTIGTDFAIFRPYTSASWLGTHRMVVGPSRKLRSDIK